MEFLAKNFHLMLMVLFIFQTDKGIKTSDSFSYKSYLSPKATTTSPRKSEDLPSYIVDGDNVLPLTHTVSFYRKQQTQVTNTPIKQIKRQPVVYEEDESSESDNSIAVQNKIQELTEEVRLLVYFVLKWNFIVFALDTQTRTGYVAN